MTDDLIDTIKAEVSGGQPLSQSVRNALAESRDPALLRQAGRALAKLPADGSGLRPVRVGIVSTATPGPLEHFLRAALVGAGMLAQFTVADYGMFDLTLAEGTDPALGGDQDVVLCLVHDAHLLPRDFSGNDVQGLVDFVSDRAGSLRATLAQAAARASVAVLTHTVPLSAQVRNAFIGWRDRAALNAGWTAANAALLGLPADVPGLHVFDFVADLAEAPVPAVDDRLRHYADIPYTDGAFVVLADAVRRFLQAKVGLSKKVLALDLDNTLWGGTLGEVGAAGITLGGLYPGKSYALLQHAAARLREQGVVLAVASKNDAEHVEETLRDHPEVVLRPDQFSALAVNWQPKIDNLRQVADQLDLGIDSFVFMDDSEFERGHVGAELPEVRVLPADGDPARLERTLLAGGLFDTLSLTDADRSRPTLYRAKVERSEYAAGFGSPSEYLQALKICVTISVASEFEVPRVAQLAARTNQFNLTGIRFDEAETAKLIADPDHVVLSWSVHDRFGDEGIVGAAWVMRGERWQVLNFVMSCRVLGRGVELAVVGWLARQARDAGASALEGRFVPSARNRVSADLWERAGLTRVGESDTEGQARLYRLDLTAAAGQVPEWITLEERWPRT